MDTSRKHTGIGKLIGGCIMTGIGLLSMLPGSEILTFNYSLNGVTQTGVSNMGSMILSGAFVLIGAGLLTSYFLKRRKAIPAA